MLRLIRIYLIPGAVLQSVMIGGGYGTGREVVEYFSNYGTMGGVFAIATAAMSIAIVFALSLEVSRVFKVYDYRNFFKVLLGRFWFLYEVLAAMLFMLVIAVIGSAAGQILQTELGIPAYLGIVIMLFAVVFLTFYGRNLVMIVLAYWSLFLYSVFITYLIVVFITFRDAFVSQAATVEPGWFKSGMQYSFYNLTAVPVILYAARAIETRREALLAGIIGALIAIIPALMLHVSFITQFPAILKAELPIYDVFVRLDLGWLKFLYLTVLFGTFIETGAGNIQGFVERLDGWWIERTGKALSQGIHGAIAAVLVMLAGILAQVGIVSLIAEGYGTLAWGFMIVYIIPLLTIGIWKLIKSPG
jgi:uncharacterized membrane protein YkvI